MLWTLVQIAVILLVAPFVVVLAGWLLLVALGLPVLGLVEMRRRYWHAVRDYLVLILTAGPLLVMIVYGIACQPRGP